MIGTIAGILWNLPIYVVLAVAMYVSLRVCKFPDFTTDGSFVLGMAGLYIGVRYFGQSSFLGLLLAIVFGGLAGLSTAFVYSYLLKREPLYKLLSGLLVMFSVMSFTFRALGRQESQGLAATLHEFNRIRNWELAHQLTPWRPISLALAAAIITVAILMLYWYLKSDKGLLLRAAGERQDVIEALGMPHRRFLVLGLMVSNALVALGGWTYGVLNNNVSSIEPGTIIDALGALLVGEALMDSLNARRRINPGLALLACVLGALAYGTASGLALAALNGIMGSRAYPQDHKLVVSLIILSTLVLSRWRGSSNPELLESSPI